MSVHKAYEVRVFRNNDWRIEAVLDDEPLAIAAAKKIEARLTKTPVVVVQEVYDAARNHLKSRSVYRSEPAVRPAALAGGGKAGSSAKSTPRPSDQQKTVRATPPAGGGSQSAVNANFSWALFGLLVAALAAYGILRSLSG